MNRQLFNETVKDAMRDKWLIKKQIFTLNTVIKGLGFSIKFNYLALKSFDSRNYDDLLFDYPNAIYIDYTVYHLEKYEMNVRLKEDKMVGNHHLIEHYSLIPVCNKREIINKNTLHCVDGTLFMLGQEEHFVKDILLEFYISYYSVNHEDQFFKQFENEFDVSLGALNFPIESLNCEK